MKTSLLARRLGLFVALYARGAENLVSFVSRFGSDVVVVLLAQADNHQLRAQPLWEMCVARGLVTAACICDQVEPHGGDWNRFWFTLPAITLAHRAPLISTTPHGATRMAVRATVDTTRKSRGRAGT